MAVQSEAQVGAKDQNDWPPEKVRAEIILRGLTMVGISKAAGLNPAAASSALRRPFRQAEKAIADAMGMEPFEIWPSRYPYASAAIAIGAAQAGVTVDPVGGRRLKVNCPMCQSKASSVRVHEVVVGIRNITYRCADPACSHQFLMQLAHVRPVAPRKGRRK